jgi:hypothetical protein
MSTGVPPPLSSACCKLFSTDKETLRPSQHIPQYMPNIKEAYNIPLILCARCLSGLVKMAPKVVPPSDVPASELEHYDSVEQDRKLLQAVHPADNLYDKIMRQKCSGTSSWWKQFTVVKVEMADQARKERWWAVRLQCDGCNAFLSSSNPSAICMGYLSGGVYRQIARRRTTVQTA